MGQPASKEWERFRQPGWETAQVNIMKESPGKFNEAKGTHTDIKRVKAEKAK